MFSVTLTTMGYPCSLNQHLILLAFKNLQVHDYDLVWMFDMNTEAQLLKHTPLCFNDLILGVNVVLIKDERGAFLALSLF